MGITLRWHDPRLVFNNLDKDEKKNALNLEEKAGIWVPSLVFPNTVNRDHKRFDNDRSTATISIIQGKSYQDWD